MINIFTILLRDRHYKGEEDVMPLDMASGKKYYPMYLQCFGREVPHLFETIALIYIFFCAHICLRADVTAS